MSTARKLYTLYISVIPPLMIYAVPGTNISLATVLTGIGMVYAGMSLINRKSEVSGKLFIPLVLYVFYLMTKSPLQVSLLMFAVLVQLVAIGTGLLDQKLFRKYVETIAVIGAICVISQQLIYFTTGIQFPFLIKSILTLDLQEQYSFLFRGGQPGLYRPSAFFLEPAHYSQYCIIGLGSCLFSEVVDKRKALLISLGLIATTSGMGFVLTFFLWGCWYLSHNRLSVKNLVVISVLLLSAFLILNSISFTHNIISRFTVDSSSGDYNSIDGRLWWWRQVFGDFTFSGFFWGFGMDSIPEGVYFTGYMQQLYCYGVFGVFLFFLFWLRLFIKTNRLGKVIALSYMG